ncbi:hypothetical protein [Spirosoma linguale]
MFVVCHQKQKAITLQTYSRINNIDTIKTENLYAFGGKKAFSMGQGQ